MEFVNKMTETLVRAAMTDTSINVILASTFAALTYRSWNQQKSIEDLEAERDSLIKANKAIKKTIWDSKQQLYAEAQSDSALIPLARLRAIYGEAPVPPKTGTKSLDYVFGASLFLMCIAVSWLRSIYFLASNSAVLLGIILGK